MGKLKFRFAVGRPGGARSSACLVFSSRNDVYATTVDGPAGVSKYSFHASGICSYAVVTERWTKVDQDRALLRWRRATTPPPDSQAAAAVLSTVFPTNHLSTALAPLKKPVHWIDPAPSGSGTEIHMLFTRDSRERLCEVFGGKLQIVAHHTLPSGESFAVAFSHAPCESPAVRMPAAHGQRELVFPRVDRFNTGRPERLRVFMPPPPADGDRLSAWEFGGHEVTSECDSREVNELTLTRNQIHWTL